jgi:hypothetical protein
MITVVDLWVELFPGVIDEVLRIGRTMILDAQDQTEPGRVSLGPQISSVPKQHVRSDSFRVAEQVAIGVALRIRSLSHSPGPGSAGALEDRLPRRVPLYVNSAEQLL